jgi:hypothetical protein
MLKGNGKTIFWAGTGKAGKQTLANPSKPPNKQKTKNSFQRR